jgi:hypothetical protein
VDRSRSRRRDVTGDPPGKRELGEELPETGFVLADVRIDLAVGALKVGMAHERRAAVTGTSDIEHIQVILLDDPVQVNINEILGPVSYPSARPQAVSHATVRAAFSEADCRRGRAGRRIDSWRHASTHPSDGVAPGREVPSSRYSWSSVVSPLFGAARVRQGSLHPGRRPGDLGPTKREPFADAHQFLPW